MNMTSKENEICSMYKGSGNCAKCPMMIDSDKRLCYATMDGRCKLARQVVRYSDPDKESLNMDAVDKNINIAIMESLDIDSLCDNIRNDIKSGMSTYGDPPYNSIMKIIDDVQTKSHTVVSSLVSTKGLLL